MRILIKLCLILCVSLFLPSGPYGCATQDDQTDGDDDMTDDEDDTDDSDDANDTDDTPTAEEDLATFIEWCGTAWDSLNLFLEEGKTLTFPVDCPGGGSMDQEGAEILLDDCVVTSGDTSYLGSGTYSLTEVGALVTHSWDQDLTVNGSNTFSSTGSISFDTADDLIAYDFSAVFGSGTHRIAGSVRTNSDNTSDATLTVSLDGTVWLDCTFDDVNLDALTEEEITTACSSTDRCEATACSDDFRCQLFADENTTDEFTTANTQCVEGCCAVVEEESDCDDNTTACTTGFQCQLFAADDLTDEFETDNVDCIDGCCALTGP